MLKTSLGRQGMDEDPDEGVKVIPLTEKISWLQEISFTELEGCTKAHNVISTLISIRI